MLCHQTTPIAQCCLRFSLVHILFIITTYNKEPKSKHFLGASISATVVNMLKYFFSVLNLRKTSSGLQENTNESTAIHVLSLFLWK